MSHEVVKTLYICDGLSEKEISHRLNLTVSTVEKIVSDNKLPELRKAFIRQGIAEIQNAQVKKAGVLMDIEASFKGMRITQLESMLRDYLGYHKKHGHFYKLHPITGDILRDMDGIPMTIKIPNISGEIKDLKESLSLSEGLKKLMSQIDDIINAPSRAVESVNDEDVIEGTFQNLFEKRKE